MRALIRLPGFLRLGVAYTLNELAVSVGTLALAVLIYRRTGSAIGSAGFFLCAQAAPALLAPVCVARLDRISPRVVLPVLYAVEAVLYGLLAWLTARFELVPVLAIAFLDGAVALTARSLAVSARTQILKPTGMLARGQRSDQRGVLVVFHGRPAVRRTAGGDRGDGDRTPGRRRPLRRDGGVAAEPFPAHRDRARGLGGGCDCGPRSHGWSRTARSSPWCCSRPSAPSSSRSRCRSRSSTPRTHAACGRQRLRRAAGGMGRRGGRRQHRVRALAAVERTHAHLQRRPRCGGSASRC